MKFIYFLIFNKNRYVWGYRSDFKQNIFLNKHEDNGKILYPAGNNIVIHSFNEQ